MVEYEGNYPLEVVPMQLFWHVLPTVGHIEVKILRKRPALINFKYIIFEHDNTRSHTVLMTRLTIL